MNNTSKYDYDVALSFAAEDRQYVEKLANILESKGVSVFYDKFEKLDLWGKDLYSYLNDTYSSKSKYKYDFKKSENDLPLVLYSVQTSLAFRINEQFYSQIHYAWCAIETDAQDTQADGGFCPY